ncbi:MAG TPA: phosphatidate cytidylyltransferase, partial [Dehalococcoidia bacterium]|nr:phosphatidate cytidylyltransferase [Dehalococcoidia bacterium]
IHQPKPRQAVLATRLATAAVGIPVVVLVIWVGGGWLAGLVGVAVFIAVMEIAIARGSVGLTWDPSRPGLLKLALAPGPDRGDPVRHALVASLLASLLPAAALAGEDYLLGAVVGAIIVQSTLFTFTRDPQADLDGWLWGVVSALYFGALAAHFILLREAPNGRDLVFFTVLTVWITDTGAYFVGRAIGRHKLSPSVSPGKTWEGSFGSWVTGFATVFGLNEAFELGLDVEHLVALGLLLPLVIMMGDLAESAVKRGLGIKDSSGLVPGHGGIADRLDSLLFAAPVVYWYLRWIVT